jgi:hypothetical protein
MQQYCYTDAGWRQPIAEGNSCVAARDRQASRDSRTAASTALRVKGFGQQFFLSAGAPPQPIRQDRPESTAREAGRAQHTPAASE